MKKAKPYLKNGKFFCDCHNVEMLWHNDSRRKNSGSKKGYHICAVKTRARKREYEKTEKGKKTSFRKNNSTKGQIRKRRYDLKKSRKLNLRKLEDIRNQLKEF